MRLVLDVSNNRTIDQRTLQQSGAVALIAKATEGTSFQDKTLQRHREAAGGLHKPFGSYLFLHPDSKGNEAEYYLRYAKPRKGDIQPVIDAEVTNLGIAELAARAWACSRVLARKGYDPLLYASSGIWTQLIVAEPRLKALRIWEAQYPGRFNRWFPRYAKLRIRLRHGVTVVMWQWTDSYEGHYDASVLLTKIERILIR